MGNVRLAAASSLVVVPRGGGVRRPLQAADIERITPAGAMDGGDSVVERDGFGVRAQLDLA